MSERKKRKNARAMLSKMGYKAGGHMGGKSVSDAKEDAHQIEHGISEHEDQLHGGKHARLHLKDGGLAAGGMPRPRSDRKARSGKKGHTTVNVVVGGHDKPSMPPIMLPPGGPPGGPPMPPPLMAGPPGGGMPPGLAGAGGPPIPGQARGGRTGYKRGGGVKVDSGRDKIKGLPDGQFKKGGRTKMESDFEGGAGGGLGRMEKAEKYGAKVKHGGRTKLAMGGTMVRPMGNAVMPGAGGGMQASMIKRGGKTK